MDVLAAIEAFVRTVDTGSMAAAGRRLGVTSTQIGNRLTALESRVHAKLLVRSTRRLDLTPFGRDYLARCREILDRLAEADLMAEARQAEPRGHLRLTAPVIFGSEILLPGLAAYLEGHPHVNVDVDLTDTIVDIDAGGFDAAIRLGKPTTGDFVARPLKPYGLMICAAPSYIDRKGAPTTPSELSGHDCLLYGSSGKVEDREIWQLLGPEGPVAVEVKGRLRAFGAQGLRRAANAGIGIALLPDVIAEADVAAGLLRPLMATYRPADRPLNILFRRERHMSRLFRSLLDHILQAHGRPAAPTPLVKENGTAR
ncbi:LysR family transcriptional regulator [Rhizobium sp. BK376]|uniref:LysR family transcriptional regulator n=1 Tax=Rhizobium sp. BK376 TaxID=2512149 RepID=UPI00104D0E43|nr:LysR family transcriptional regulator [Rhizobium sp. BK376]TCR63912.1 LysR family transcriptional regulator [Rhizobium sp. BK376]